MARQPFGGTGADLVYNPGTAPGDPVTNVIGLTFIIFEDETGTTPADITTMDDVVIQNATVTVDGTSQLPRFKGPDTDPETYDLWCQSQAGGPIFHIYRNGGLPGSEGPPGPTPDDSAIDAAVARYLDANQTFIASNIPVDDAGGLVQGPSVQSALEALAAKSNSADSLFFA